MRLAGLGCLVFGLAAPCAQPALAQPAGHAATVGEVVVTAQRRPEIVHDVPIFVSAASGETLQFRQATEMSELGKVFPSLVMRRTGAFTQPYLRGVGKRSTLGVENGVATYVDGVYLASSIGALLDLRGVSRVEVLSGPQGTLFGRNTSGGVIQLVTRDPTAEPEAEVALHLGTYGYGRGDVYLTGGAVDFAANLALSFSRNDGYGSNLFTGKTDQGEVRHSLVGRTKWVWRPSETAAVTLAADYQDIDQDFSQRPVAGFAAVGQPRVRGFRDGDQDAPNRYHFRYGGASLKAEFDLGATSLTSLTAARWMHARYGADLDQGPQPLLSAAPRATQSQVSQELQLQSEPAAPVRWLAGLYYIRIEERYDPTTFSYGGAYSAMLDGRTFQALTDRGVATSYAAYGQATAPLGRRTRLTGGLRYTIETRSVEARGERRFDTAPFVRPIPGLPLTTEAPLYADDTFRQLTWRASLDHDVTDTTMAYVSASRGFQSGGWNLQTPQSPPFAPETLVAFEVGLKYLARSGRFSFDAAAFAYDYADLQVSAFTPLGSVTTNATSADIYGLDAQFEALVTPQTRASLGAQYLHARFNAFRNAACADYSAAATVPYAPVVCDASGNRLPFAPALRVNLGLRHEVAAGRNGVVVVGGSLAYNSTSFSEADNVVRQPRFATLDLSAEWRPTARGPAVRLWALNVTGARHYDSLTTFPTTGVLQRPAAPRRVGISLTYGL